MIKEGYAVPIIECHGRFHRPVLYDDELRIISQIGEVRSRAFRVEHAVWRGEELVGQGYEVRIWVRLEPGSGRLEPETIPAEVRALIEEAS